MKHIFWLWLAWSGAVLATESQSAYVGQEHRQIKSLSAATIDAYETGKGMGLAKAAELNGYPGPLHVLQLGQELALTRQQTEQMTELYQSMRQEAVPLGKAIVRLEAELDAHFANRTINSHLLQHLTHEIGLKQGALRAVHLQRHLDAVGILSAEQSAAYHKLRGYSHHEPAAHAEHHPH